MVGIVRWRLVAREAVVGLQLEGCARSMQQPARCWAIQTPRG